PRLEAIVARGDRADRTHVHQISREERDDAFFLKRGNLAAITAIDDPDLGVAVDLTHEPDASRAENAPVAIQHQGGPKIDVGLDALAVEDASRKLHAAAIRSERVRKVLQRALAAFVAHGAIERMIDEKKLEHARPRGLYIR